METATSKVTIRYRVTIPEAVRRALRLKAGDTVAFDIQGDSIQLRKARSVDLAFAKSLEGTLSEWMSAADEDAYRDL